MQEHNPDSQANKTETIEETASRLSVWEAIQETWMSYALIAVFIAVFSYELWLNYNTVGLAFKIDSRVLFHLGANVPQALAQGQIWRAFTACFLHADLMHLAMNSLALYYFGPIIERSFGPWKTLLFFVLTGLIGSLASSGMHWQEPFLSVGASGGLYGLFGCLFAAAKRYPSGLGKGFQTWLNQNLGLLIVFSFAPSIDTWGHFGGLIPGLMIGALVRPDAKHE